MKRVRGQFVFGVGRPSAGKAGTSAQQPAYLLDGIDKKFASGPGHSEYELIVRQPDPRRAC